MINSALQGKTSRCHYYTSTHSARWTTYTWHQQMCKITILHFHVPRDLILCTIQMKKAMLLMRRPQIQVKNTPNVLCPNRLYINNHHVTLGKSPPPPKCYETPLKPGHHKHVLISTIKLANFTNRLICDN